jgi:hypothetical protein
MFEEEIEVPKELREFMIQGAEETKLGQKNGAKRQYRYGNLHIREYDDKYLVHTDKVDPRQNPLGHLIHDAPEVLVGLACAALGTIKIKSALKQKKSLVSGILGSLVLGYAGYLFTKKLKDSKVR